MVSDLNTTTLAEPIETISASVTVNFLKHIFYRGTGKFRTATVFHKWRWVSVLAVIYEIMERTQQWLDGKRL